MRIYYNMCTEIERDDKIHHGVRLDDRWQNRPTTDDKQLLKMMIMRALLLTERFIGLENALNNNNNRKNKEQEKNNCIVFNFSNNLLHLEISTLIITSKWVCIATT